MARRNFPLQEFQVAESDPGSSRVTCACIGRKSHQVVASGTDGKSVCLWKVSKSLALGVLKGHTSDVLSVTFSASEDFVYSGAEGGTVFVWDLNAARTAFSLKGHMAGCKCIYPSTATPHYLVTGSADTNVKVWDLRRKQCVQTFKGHRAPVTSVMFSPDSQWVASGSEDGTVKVWDLGTSKRLVEFALGESPVSMVRFNPQNLSLASGHADRTVKFWDLEKLAHISTTSPDSTGISAICFEPNEGLHLFSAASESLKCWEIEASVMLDNIESTWRGVMDMDISSKNEMLIGLAAYGTNFSVWTTDLNTVNFIPPVQEVSSVVVEKRPPRRPNVGPPKSYEAPTLVSAAKSVDFTTSFIPTDSRHPIGINAADFLSDDSRPVLSNPADTGLDSSGVLQKLQSGHRYFIEALSERIAALKNCADYMRRGNVQYAVHEIMRGTDFSIAVGILKSFLIDEETDMSIDHCTSLLALAHWLLEANNEAAVTTAAQSALAVIRRFSEFFISTLTAPETIGVDLSKEDRRKKCKSCLQELQKISLSHALQTARVSAAKELSQEYETLSRRVGNSLD